MSRARPRPRTELPIVAGGNRAPLGWATLRACLDAHTTTHPTGLAMRCPTCASYLTACLATRPQPPTP